MIISIKVKMFASNRPAARFERARARAPASLASTQHHFFPVPHKEADDARALGFGGATSRRRRHFRDSAERAAADGWAGSRGLTQNYNCQRLIVPERIYARGHTRYRCCYE